MKKILFLLLLFPAFLHSQPPYRRVGNKLISGKDTLLEKVDTSLSGYFPTQIPKGLTIIKRDTVVVHFILNGNYTALYKRTTWYRKL
jgi:hypothetical protein